MNPFDRNRNALGVVPGEDRLRWWPAGLLALLVPLGIWLGAAFVGSAELEGAPAPAAPAAPQDAADEAPELLAFEEDGKWGFQDADGKVVVKPRYDEVGRFAYGLAPVNLGAERDMHGRKSGGKWGYIDTRGKVVVPITLDIANEFSDGLASVFDDSGFRYLDPNGKAVITLGDVSSAGYFSEGLAPIQEHQLPTEKDQRTKFIDKKGTTLFVVDGSAHQFHEGMAVLTVSPEKIDPSVSNERHLDGYIDRTGKVAIPPRFAEAHHFHEGLAAVRPKKTTPYWGHGDSWGYIDKSGKYVIEPQFNEAGPFQNGVARVHVGGALVNTTFHSPPSWKGGRWQWIDKTGKVVKPPTEDGAGKAEAGDGVVAARTEEKRTDLPQGQVSDDLVELSARVERTGAGGILTISVKNKSSGDLYIDRRLIYLLRVVLLDKGGATIELSEPAGDRPLPPVGKPDFGVLASQSTVSRTLTFGREETTVSVAQKLENVGGAMRTVDWFAHASLRQMPPIDRVGKVSIIFGNVDDQKAALRMHQLGVQMSGKLYGGQVQLILTPPAKDAAGKKDAGKQPQPPAEKTTAKEGAAPAETGVTVQGTVVDAKTGKPVQGARVAPMVFRSPGESPDWDRKVETDADGKFTLQEVDGSVRIQVAHPDYYDFECDFFNEGGKKPGEKLYVVRVALESGEKLTGVVKDPAGKPLAAVEVEDLAGKKTVTGNDGRFALKSIKYYVEIKAKGYIGQTLQPEKIPAEEITIVLEPLLRIPGRVLSPDGRPVRQFTVAAGPGRNPSMYDCEQAKVDDPQGRWELRTEHRGTHWVGVRAEGFAPWEGWTEVGKQNEPFTVRLQSGVSVTGKVRGPRGNVREAQIVLTPQRADGDGIISYGTSSRDMGVISGVSRADGTFRLEHVRPDNYLLSVSGKGVTPLDLSLAVPEKGLDCGELAVQGTGRVVGVLYDPKGKEHRQPFKSGLVVCPYPGAPAGESISRSISFEADEQGRFAVEDVPAGPVSVEFGYMLSDDCLGSYSRTAVVAEGRATEVRFFDPKKAWDLPLQVVVGDGSEGQFNTGTGMAAAQKVENVTTGNPMFLAELEPEPGQTVSFPRPDWYTAEGFRGTRIAVPDVHPGKYRLRLSDSHQGNIFMSHQGNIFMKSVYETPIEVPAKSPIRIPLAASSITGRAQWTKDYHHLVMVAAVEENRKSSPRYAYCDEKGNFCLRYLSPGRYTICLHDDDAGYSRLEHVVLAEAATIAVKPQTLGPGGTIAGTVRWTSSRPIPDRLTLTDAQGIVIEPREEFRGLNGGEYRFSGLWPGRWTLAAWSGKDMLASGLVDVQGTETISGVLTLNGNEKAGKPPPAPAAPAAKEKATAQGTVEAAKAVRTTVAKPAARPAPIRIDLSPFGDPGATLEFSTQSDYVNAWWWPKNKVGDYAKLPGTVVVFSTQGNRVAEATDKNGSLQGKYVEMFPETAWRTYFAEFVKHAAGWGFTRDYRLGFRMVDPRRQEALMEISKGELWQFKPEKKLLWRVDLPPFVEHARLAVVDFFEKDAHNFIVLSDGGTDGYILDGRDGSLVNKFTFGHIETDEEARAFKKKFHIRVSDGDPMLRFSSYELSVEPSRRLLACGAFWGRRVRIVSLDAPFQTVFEANTDDNPCPPLRGIWRVKSVRFSGGKYLVVEYDLGGRLALGPEQPTDIFDIDSKTSVWSENLLEVGSVRLSPDGKKLGFVKRGILEIEEFQPQVSAADDKEKDATQAPPPGKEPKIEARFTAKVEWIEIEGKRKADVVPVENDPHWLVGIDILSVEKAEKPFDKNGKAVLLIHSPARLFSGGEAKAPGETYLFKVLGTIRDGRPAFCSAHAVRYNRGGHK